MHLDRNAKAERGQGVFEADQAMAARRSIRRAALRSSIPRRRARSATVIPWARSAPYRAAFSAIVASGATK
jgi:hypothetical protein